MRKINNTKSNIQDAELQKKPPEKELQETISSKAPNKEAMNSVKDSKENSTPK